MTWIARAYSEDRMACQETFDILEDAETWCNEQAARDDITMAEVRPLVIDITPPAVFAVRVGMTQDGIQLTETTRIASKDASARGSTIIATGAWNYRYEVDDTPVQVSSWGDGGLTLWNVKLKGVTVRSFPDREKAELFAEAANYVLDGIVDQDPMGRLRLDVDWKFPRRTKGPPTPNIRSAEWFSGKS